jgi:hypothetical protein
MSGPKRTPLLLPELETKATVRRKENKQLGRLNKMCYPFFREFRVIPSANGFQLLVYSPKRRLTLIGVLLALAGREAQWAMIVLVKETSESRLLGQRPLSCKTLLIPATGSLELAASAVHVYVIVHND